MSNKSATFERPNSKLMHYYTWESSYKSVVYSLLFKSSLIIFSFICSFVYLLSPKVFLYQSIYISNYPFICLFMYRNKLK